MYRNIEEIAATLSDFSEDLNTYGELDRASFIDEVIQSLEDLKDTISGWEHTTGEIASNYLHIADLSQMSMEEKQSVFNMIGSSLTGSSDTGAAEGNLDLTSYTDVLNSIEDITYEAKNLNPAENGIEGFKDCAARAAELAQSYIHSDLDPSRNEKLQEMMETLKSAMSSHMEALPEEIKEKFSFDSETAPFQKEDGQYVSNVSWKIDNNGILSGPFGITPDGTLGERADDGNIIKLEDDLNKWQSALNSIDGKVKLSDQDVEKIKYSITKEEGNVKEKDQSHIEVLSRFANIISHEIYHVEWPDQESVDKGFADTFGKITDDGRILERLESDIKDNDFKEKEHADSETKSGYQEGKHDYTDSNRIKTSAGSTKTQGGGGGRPSFHGKSAEWTENSGNDKFDAYSKMRNEYVERYQVNPRMMYNHPGYAYSTMMATLCAYENRIDVRGPGTHSVPTMWECYGAFQQLININPLDFLLDQAIVTFLEIIFPPPEQVDTKEKDIEGHSEKDGEEKYKESKAIDGLERSLNSMVSNIQKGIDSDEKIYTRPSHNFWESVANVQNVFGKDGNAAVLSVINEVLKDCTDDVRGFLKSLIQDNPDGTYKDGDKRVDVHFNYDEVSKTEQEFKNDTSADEKAEQKTDADSEDKEEADSDASKDKTESDAHDKAEGEEQTEAEPKDQTEAEAKDQTEAEPKDQTEVEAKDQTEAEPKDQTEAEAKDQTEAEPKEQTEAEPKEQTEAEPKDQTEAEPKEQTESEPKEQTEAEAKDQTESDPKGQTVSDPKEQAEAEPKEQTAAESKEQEALDPKEQTVSEPKEQTVSDPKEQAQPDAKTESDEEKQKIDAITASESGHTEVQPAAKDDEADDESVKAVTGSEKTEDEGREEKESAETLKQEETAAPVTADEQGGDSAPKQPTPEEEPVEIPQQVLSESGPGEGSSEDGVEAAAAAAGKSTDEIDTENSDLKNADSLRQDFADLLDGLIPQYGIDDFLDRKIEVNGESMSVRDAIDNIDSMPGVLADEVAKIVLAHGDDIISDESAADILSDLVIRIDDVSPGFMESVMDSLTEMVKGQDGLEDVISKFADTIFERIDSTMPDYAALSPFDIADLQAALFNDLEMIVDDALNYIEAALANGDLDADKNIFSIDISNLMPSSTESPESLLINTEGSAQMQTQQDFGTDPAQEAAARQLQDFAAQPQIDTASPAQEITAPNSGGSAEGAVDDSNKNEGSAVTGDDEKNKPETKVEESPADEIAAGPDLETVDLAALIG